DQWLPLRFPLSGDLRVAVAREIHEHERVVHAKEVDLSRPARGLAYAGELLPPDQRIEKGRFADVGPASEGDLGQPGLGAPSGAFGGSAEEFQAADDEGLRRRGHAQSYTARNGRRWA